jgi:hypothetical protein
MPKLGSMPSRVLDLEPFSGHLDLRLVSGDHTEDAPYAALSHCWGAYEPPCKTTRGTIADRETRIPWSLLPKTFQDAIKFIRRLGLRYLWIDTICIIQDDTDDWLRESSRMHSVYKNAFLTIAAASSRDSRDGLFS